MITCRFKQDTESRKDTSGVWTDKYTTAGPNPLWNFHYVGVERRKCVRAKAKPCIQVTIDHGLLLPCFGPSAASSIYRTSFQASKQFFLRRCDPMRAMASTLLRFLDHTQLRIRVGRTPLDTWSVRRSDFYLTTQNTHNRQTALPPAGFETTVSAGQSPQTYVLDRAATGIGRQNN